MNVLLFRVGRNLNRAYRTAEAFGVERLLLLECAENQAHGNLFGATGRVEVVDIGEWPDGTGLLALEPRYHTHIARIDWGRVETVVVGGENVTLPRALPAEQRAMIPMVGKVSCLTVEAALAIALYEWRRSERI
jgi:tRNA G18 (ribose-2'-O)-methylase SpoU